MSEIKIDKHRDLFLYVLANLKNRQLRSWLTVLGIIIGITAIVTLIAIAQGLDGAVKKELAAFGADSIMVTPQISLTGGATMSGSLDLNDVEVIRRTPGMDPSRVTSILVAQLTLGYKNTNVSTYISGVDTDTYAKAVEDLLPMGEGRMLKPGDSHVLVIGSAIAKDMFGESIGLNTGISIAGERYRVIGIMKPSGSALGGGYDSDIYVPLQNVRDILGTSVGSKEVTFIWARTQKGADTEVVADRLDQRLMAKRKVKEDDKDYTVMTSKSIMDQIGVITGLLATFLGGVAAISLLVGGIGIANTMFMSVMERTREIGILKAVGARRSIILEIFVMEAGIIGLGGGLIGIALGVLISAGLGAVGVPSSVTFELCAFALLFSVGVGTVAGYFPARRASELQAVDALRYE
ncbi:MAG: ABC transporter permease [Candidatus Burarchaeum sp.]|nr:ABC transporter permease [Candidatus Burarchaeum sp.]MDO8339168.1 ABC transporter permease [Candidatus Burarchaeum sp.]